MSPPLHRSPDKGSTRYRIEASREGLRVNFDERFFDNTVVAADGTTQLDINIATLVQDIRTGLYYLGTDGTPH